MNHGKKKILVVLISFFLSIFFFYFLFCIKTYLNKYDELSYLFRSIENIELHKKYSKKLHHLRGPGTLKNIDKPENYLFSTINQFSKNTNNILIQGDSWIRRTERFKEPYNLINNFSKKNNVGLITAGIASYSPSLMKLQYEILEKDFNIYPDILVAYIDQTDIGDELCRYKDKRVFDENNNLIAVKEEYYSKGTFEYLKIYKISEIKLLNDSKIIRSIKLTNFFIEYGVRRGIEKIKSIKELGLKRKVNFKCSFSEIQKYLIKSSDNEILYFTNRLKDYINLLKSKDYIKKIIFVTFPHNKHLFKNNDSENQQKHYSINVSTIVQEIVKNEKKIHHLNFSQLISQGKINLEKYVFQENDPGSHLKTQYHASIFVQKIIDQLIVD